MGGSVERLLDFVGVILGLIYSVATVFQFLIECGNVGSRSVNPLIRLDDTVSPLSVEMWGRSGGRSVEKECGSVEKECGSVEKECGSAEKMCGSAEEKCGEGVWECGRECRWCGGWPCRGEVQVAWRADRIMFETTTWETSMLLAHVGRQLRAPGVNKNCWCDPEHGAVVEVDGRRSV